MVAVIGRWRVGKTFLVRSVYAQQIRFEVTGLQNSTTRAQLNNFYLHLKDAFKEYAPTKKPSDWLEAFFQLTDCLNKTVNFNEKFVFF